MKSPTMPLCSISLKILGRKTGPKSNSIEEKALPSSSLGTHTVLEQSLPAPWDPSLIPCSREHPSPEQSFRGLNIPNKHGKSHRKGITDQPRSSVTGEKDQLLMSGKPLDIYFKFSFWNPENLKGKLRVKKQPHGAELPHKQRLLCYLVIYLFIPIVPSKTTSASKTHFRNNKIFDGNIS